MVETRVVLGVEEGPWTSMSRDYRKDFRVATVGAKWGRRKWSTGRLIHAPGQVITGVRC